MARLSSFLIYVVAFYSFRTYAIETKHLSMQVGSQKTIQLPANDRVQVSKRGIIYLTHAERDNWIVTATHPGMVIVDAISQKASKKQYMIKVFPPVSAPSIRTEAEPERRYRISGKIILAEDSEMEKLGLSPTGSFFAASPTFNPKIDLTAQFQALIHDKKVNVIGEPMIEVNSGAPAVVKSGGEMLMLVIDPVSEKFSKAIWKEYGIQMNVTAFPSQDQQVRLDTDFSLRHRSPENSESQMTLSQIKTSVHAKKGTAFIAGSSSFQATGNSNQTIPIIGKIPIIGPLFTQKQNDVLNSKLFLWMKVEELN